MIDAGDIFEAEAWATTMVGAREKFPESFGVMCIAYLAGVKAERRRNRRLILSMAKRIAAQSEKLTRKSKKKG